MKQKHRRRERYVVSGWVPGESGRPNEFLTARLDGKPAGRVSFGLSATERSKLRGALAGAEARCGRGRVRWAKPIVEVEVDAHGPEGGPVRDPIVRGWQRLEVAR